VIAVTAASANNVVAAGAKATKRAATIKDKIKTVEMIVFIINPYDK
tara:strand:- start:212 stop:349 length:138 start_codon:yes stop_codon:yes gene_type:complete